MSPTDFSVSDPTLAVVAGGLVALAIGSVMVAKAMRRHAPHRFQDDADYARARAIEATEAEIERLKAILTGPPKRGSSGRFLSRKETRDKLALAESRLRYLTGQA